MDIQDFKFETSTLFYSFIEEEIAERCNIDYSNSSGGPLYIEEGSHNIYIYGARGSVQCRVMVYKSEGSDKYIIEVSGISVTQKRR